MGTSLGYTSLQQGLVDPNEFLIGWINEVCVVQVFQAGLDARVRCDWSVLRALQRHYQANNLKTAMEQLKVAITTMLVQRHPAPLFSGRQWGLHARASHHYQVGLIAGKFNVRCVVPRSIELSCNAQDASKASMDVLVDDATLEPIDMEGGPDAQPQVRIHNHIAACKYEDVDS